MRKGKVVALGSLAGLAIGAISGILFAPEKGSKTRSQIKNKSDEYVNDLKSKLNEFSDSLTGKLARARRDAEYLAQKGKTKYDDAKKDVKNAASDMKHSAV